MQKTTSINFWNGNRSAPRQVYEREVLYAVLEATKEEWGDYKINENLEDYPGKMESLAFSVKNDDVLITIAGNQKFNKDDVIMIPIPLMKNLLGYQIPIIRKEDENRFNNIHETGDIQKMMHGIPKTWTDVEIFKHNSYNVLEDGDFDDIFERLSIKLFDYTAFGANEILELYRERDLKQKGLVIEKNILLFYPFPLVFYVNPTQPKLAERIVEGLDNIIDSGKLEKIYQKHFGDINSQLQLSKRKLFVLENPMLPSEFKHIQANPNQL